MNVKTLKDHKYGIGVAIVGLVAILTIATIPASAAGTIYVNTTDTNDAVTYNDLQTALDNAESGDTIEIASDNYTGEYEVNTDNVTIALYNTSNSDAIIDATNSTYGKAFFGPESHNLTLGSNITIQQDVVYVDNAGTAEFTSIQSAIDSVDNSTTIAIEGGEYSESLNITKQNLQFINRYPNTDSVTINATNTESGEAFTGEYESDIRIGGYITVEENVYTAGGAIAEFTSQTIIGIPIWAWVIAVIAVGYVVNDSQ